MKIKNKLSLLYTALTAAILLAFAGLIYYSAYQKREAEFYKSLKKEAITKANLFLNAKVEAKTLQTIYLSNREILNEVEAAIYDTSFALLYHDAVNIDVVKETKQMLREVMLKKEIYFYQNKWQVVGVEYKYTGKNYIVTASAYDQHGYDELQNLFKTISTVFFCSIVLIYFVGRFFSKKVLSPISNMVHKVKDITATNLDLRIPVKGKDELAELASTFNGMLDGLEKSFDSQKEFVSNISHELRTPLSAIITELQLASEKDRAIAEYKSVIQNALNDSKKLVKLSNSLLDLAKASYDVRAITFKNMRLDEILIDAQNQVIKWDSSVIISISFENEIDEIIVHGNEYLLKTGFINLMENACKFSKDKHCIVTISESKNKAILKFTDKGVGITPEDLKHIFMPFFRGENKTVAEGNGIGLSLTKKIIELHKGTISVVSSQNNGTTFVIELPKT